MILCPQETMNMKKSVIFFERGIHIVSMIRILWLLLKIGVWNFFPLYFISFSLFTRLNFISISVTSTKFLVYIIYFLISKLLFNSLLISIWFSFFPTFISKSFATYGWYYSCILVLSENKCILGTNIGTL